MKMFHLSLALACLIYIDPFAKPHADSFYFTSKTAGIVMDSLLQTKWWVLKSVPAIKGVIGRLNIVSPPGVIRRISIHSKDGKHLMSFREHDKNKFHNLAPGEYQVRLMTIPVKDVPIRSGKETRIKAGFLEIISEGEWELYDESGTTYYIGEKKRQKMMLPAGNYQLKFGGAFDASMIVIQDGQTVVY